MNAPLRHTDEPAATFVRRHIGPSPRDITAMLETVGASSLRALMAETLPSSIRQKAPLDLGPPLGETEALCAYARTGLEKSGLHLADRPGLFRHDSAGGDPAQHPGKSGLVHGLYAVPAGDQPGPAGGPVQLPDHDLRSHGPRRRQRLAARRGDRGGRSDGAGGARSPGEDEDNVVLRRCRGASADAGRAAHPGRAIGMESHRRRSLDGSRSRRGVRRIAAISGHLGRGARPAPGDRGAAGQGRARHRRRRSLRR